VCRDWTADPLKLEVKGQSTPQGKELVGKSDGVLAYGLIWNATAAAGEARVIHITSVT